MSESKCAGPSAQARPSSAVRSFLAVAASAAVVLAAGTAAAHHGALGSGGFVAPFQDPGYPEGIVVEGDRYYVAGPADFDQPSVAVRAFDRSSDALVETIDITHAGSDPTDALSCITSDGDGRLYVISEAQGIVRLTQRGGTWEQELYAPLPADGIPGCVHFSQLVPQPGDPLNRLDCHLLNDLAFTPDGALYVTDSFRATIYRIAPGGGAMEPWFTSPSLVGGGPLPIGTNGIRINPWDGLLYFTVTTTPGASPAVSGPGTLYTLPLVDAPTPGDLRSVHAFAPGLGPDGIAFGATGNIFAVLAFGGQLSILDPHGDEIDRLSSPPGSSEPYDTPANIAFDGLGEAWVTNHVLLTNIVPHMGVLRITVDDPGVPLFKPLSGYCDGDGD
jgi:sugar lactone lactonase YvrE